MIDLAGKVYTKDHLAKLIAMLFKNEEGNDLVLSPTQLEIAFVITRLFPFRNIALTATQFGKSLAVAIGVLLRTATTPERFAIVAPKEEQSKIIMSYVIEHTFDHPLFISQLNVDDNLERLKRERSKSHLTFKGSGAVRTFTSEAKSKKKVKGALMGFGSKNVIEEESALIPDDVHATVKRMLGGHAQNFLFELGNAWERNHFQRTWDYDQSYNKIFADYQVGIKEGRFTPDFIEEMRKEPLFSILYGCQFPSRDDADERGFRFLFSDQELAHAFLNTLPEDKRKGEKILGVDIARGGNWNFYTIRQGVHAWRRHKDKSKDLMATAHTIKDIAKQEKIPPENVFIDDTGVGGGVTDRLAELDFEVNGCHEGGSAENKQRFFNAKAEANFSAKRWLMDGGKMVGDEFKECKEIMYKIQNGRILMESKEDMKARGLESPDAWDSLSLTFYAQTAGSYEATVF